ncbi:hypothetical protein K431DRAFT_283557 [Polychaeton citri CBS 116435]|uniref:Uncharacterized protein n=1 Tax=Polychaeton citri CBS 116435 TaxID=1314669 RepID=A0A9P4Q8V1_9PEZI|nr:hypothetical protein K431DRAFT_283557 [Polychaeton citri CBS 116435]
MASPAREDHTNATKTPGLLRLPLELRQQIYSHLLPPMPTTHPIPSVGLTSVTPSPPALRYLLVHPALTSELVSYFYTVATWKLVLSHAFNFFRVDATLSNLLASRSLRRIRRLDLVFFQDVLLVKEYPSFGLERFSEEIRRRAERACEVLGQAGAELRWVGVSWVDTTAAGGTGGWEVKRRILEPLGRLVGRGIRFEVGKVVSPDVEDEGRFVRALRAVVGDGMDGGSSDGVGSESSGDRPGGGSGNGFDGEEGGQGKGRKEDKRGVVRHGQHDPFYLRQLAFDVRQGRNLCDFTSDSSRSGRMSRVSSVGP